ncbi:MAG TPA: O-antigen ligase family protein, partial [Chloroflexota bacterium]
AVTAERAWQTAALGLGVLLTIAACLLTYSRGGLAGLGVALAIATIVAIRRAGVASGAGPLVAVGVLLGGLGLASAFVTGAPQRMLAELDRGAYQATYDTPDQVVASAGRSVEVRVRLTNHAQRTWRAEGAERTVLGYHIRRPDGSFDTYLGVAATLPSDIAPGQTRDLLARVAAPLSPGVYTVEWDGLREGLTWFSWSGAGPGRTVLTVDQAPSGEVADALPNAPVNFPPPGRLLLWSAAWRIAGEHPLLGVGPDNYHFAFEAYTALPIEQSGGIKPHSVWLWALANTGLLGLASLALLAGSLLRTLILRQRVSAWRADSHVWRWQVAFLGAVAAWFVQGLVDDVHQSWPVFVIFAIVVGLALASTESDPIGG